MFPLAGAPRNTTTGATSSGTESLVGGVSARRDSRTCPGEALKVALGDLRPGPDDVDRMPCCPASTFRAATHPPVRGWPWHRRWRQAFCGGRPGRDQDQTPASDRARYGRLARTVAAVPEVHSNRSFPGLQVSLRQGASGVRGPLNGVGDDDVEGAGALT